MSNGSFKIDDTAGVSENLTAFAQIAAGIDAPLGAKLEAYLAKLTSAEVDEVSIWSALYEATKPAMEDAPPEESRNDEKSDS